MRLLAAVVVASLIVACASPGPAKKAAEPEWTMEELNAAFAAKESRSREEFDRLNSAAAAQQDRSRREFEQLNAAAAARG